MALELTPSGQQDNQAPLSPDNLYQLVKSGPSWAFRHNGKLVALIGHCSPWAGRTVLWAFLGADCGPCMIALTKHVKAEIARLEFSRVEAYAEVTHAQGNRWLELMGFTREGVMRKFAYGTDYNLYSWVN